MKISQHKEYKNIKIEKSENLKALKLIVTYMVHYLVDFKRFCCDSYSFLAQNDDF